MLHILLAGHNAFVVLSTSERPMLVVPISMQQPVLQRRIALGVTLQGTHLLSRSYAAFVLCGSGEREIK